MTKKNELRLSLKRKWFDMTKPGIKPEDYRELTPYWYTILCLYRGKKRSKIFWEDFIRGSKFYSQNELSFKQFDINTLTLGYPSSEDKERIHKREHKGIEIRTGNPEWGAEPGRIYFVIMHGDVINH